jgi:transposase
MGTCAPEIIENLPAVKSTRTTKRERRSLELKRQIVEETLVVGASVARVARAYGVNANQVFAWRRLYEAGKLGKPVMNPARLLPVSVAETTAEAILQSKPGGGERSAGGTIHLEMRKARVRIEGKVDPELLRLVLRALQG